MLATPPWSVHAGMIDRLLAHARFGLAALALLVALETRGGDLEEAWRLLAGAEYRAALTIFQQHQQAAEPRRREALLGEAVTLLNLQPRLPGNLQRARRLGEELVNSGPEDDWMLQARYLLGRAAELHTDPPDYATAADHYTWLFSRRPETEIAQVAQVRFAILQLQTPAPAAERRARYTGLRAQEAAFTHAHALRDFHLVLAEACFVYELGRAEALHHCRAALAAGIEQPIRRATVILRIAELARELGEHELAREHYRRFLAVSSHGDSRLQLVRDRLAALDGGEGGPSP